MPKPAYRVALTLLLGFAVSGTVGPLEARAAIDFRPSASQRVSPRPVYMTAGDLDQDGRDDLVVVSPASRTLSVFLAADTEFAELSLKVEYALDGDTPKGPVLGYFSNPPDDVLDVAVPVTAQGRVRLFAGVTDAAGNPTGQLKAAGSIDGFSNPTWVAIGNIARQTPGDVLVAERGGAVTLAKNISGRFALFRRACLDSNDRPAACTTGPRPEQMWLVDLNQDGVPDFVTLNMGGDREKSVSLALGVSGGGTPADVYFKSPVRYLLGDLPQSPIIADVNADGHPDLLAITVPKVAASESQITTLYGNADGTFSNPASFIVACPYFVGDGSCRAQALTSGDFDGDGHLDLALALNDPRTESEAEALDALLVLVGRGNGTFSPGPVSSIADGVLQLVSGNIGGNALPDLAISTSGPIVQPFTNRSSGGNLGNGEQCEFGDECASSRCIDGVCCATSCGAGERCDVPDQEGICLPVPEQPKRCTNGNQCESTFCVNGYCCNSECTDGRCDNPGFQGVCVPGRENGEACDNNRQCASMICSVNKVCCNERCQGGFCDERGICQPLLDLGDECDADLECSTRVCDVFNRICCAERCDPDTEDCNPEGQCVRLDATPSPTPTTPVPTATSTPRSTPADSGERCSVAGDCQSTFCVNDVCCQVSACSAGQHCAEGSGQCVAGGTPTPTPTATSPPTVPPNPCDPNPCAPGRRCIVGNDSTALCVSSSSGGCATSGGGESGNLLVAAALPPLLWLGRRWQRPRSAVRWRGRR